MGEYDHDQAREEGQEETTKHSAAQLVNSNSPGMCPTLLEGGQGG